MPTRLLFPFTGQKVNWNINPDVTAEYKKAVAFRNSNAAVRRGKLFTYGSDDVCVFTKELEGSKILVAVNLRNRVVDFGLPASLAGSTWITF